MECPGCGEVVAEILVRHEYTIKYDKEQDMWVKDVGEVSYSCGGCTEELDIHDIEDILRQVDEL